MRIGLYEYILRSGSAGYTEAELCHAYGISADAMRHRRALLERNGKIVAGRCMRRNHSGRRAMVWLSSRVVNKLNKNKALTAF